MSRIRNTQYNTVHHLTSRIAHRARFLEAEEQNDFLDLVLRVSAFSGVELIGWCVMNNHFHILVYLPVPPLLTDDEVLARYRLLKDDASRLLSDEDDDRIVNPYVRSGAGCQTPRASLDDRAEAREELVKSIRRRMYSIAEYMRMIKKWFSDDYNERSGHKGTMWEAVYGDSFLDLPDAPGGYAELRDRLAYIHLNPVRAAMTDRFGGYVWSSYSAYRNGDAVATQGMHRAYPEMTDEEIVACHEERMTRLLEEWKRKRAEEIARKRQAGYELPADALTEECLIAQAKARLERVQEEVARMQLEREVTKGTKAIRAIVRKQILALASVYPETTPQALSSVLKVPLRSVQRYLEGLIKDGSMQRFKNGWVVRSAA